MKAKKLAAYLVGATAACALIVGALFLMPEKGATIFTAVVTICLAVAFGILFPNPVSVVYLIAGICSLVFPAWIVGLILIFLGVVCAIVNVIVSKKAWKLF